ncbi:MAG: SPOR domain-containing protein [Acidaminococcaceae bacterium]|nr:SPOR domain-containing protein [Acidaminococcaceae bacterium]
MGYTNSPMVAYTKLSPNHSGQRKHSIDRITPHCVVGQCSVETLGNIFYPTSRQASCQYGIGADGRVGMYVEEKNRSWCTSSNENDQRAITIECASDTTHPYAFKDIVYQTLIKLCVDICKRNGKNKLLWLGDKNKTLAYEPKDGEMVLTVHRWYANKSCPGDWMYARMGDLAAKVTAQLGGTTPVTEEKPQTVTPVATSTSDNEKTIWDFLKGKGLNDFAVAGIMGNLYAESGLRPNNLQNTYEKKLGMTDDQYTAAVDKGTYGNFVKDSAGYGLAQWTYWSRKQALLEFAKAAGKSIGDLAMQLDFLWKELQTYTGTMKLLKAAESVKAASNAILTGYEKPADQGTSVQNKRAGYGVTYYDKYAGKTTTTPSASGTLYRVQVGAFSKKENADKQLAAVQAKGFDSFITKVGNLYKVQVGAYSVKSNADAQLNRLKAAGFSDAFITTAGAGTVVATTPAATKTVEELAREVIAGKWGNGDDRKKALTDAGYDYSAVQQAVNSILA